MAFQFAAFGYRFNAGLYAKAEQRSRDEELGKEWRETWPRVERSERTGRITYAEAFFGPLMLTMEDADTYWWDDVRLPFGYRLGLDRWISEWQRGFWFHRDDARTVRVGLGNMILHMVRLP